MRRSQLVTLGFFGALWLACGSDGSDVGVEPPDGGTPGDSDAGVTNDGSFDNDGAVGSDGSANDGANVDGGTACPGGCPVGQVCTNGTCACPRYTKLCGGSCIPVVADPANCGDCNVSCTADGGSLACSAGTCSSTCLPGTDPCGGACVDRGIDNANCGTCGHGCGSGDGCVNGTCRAATTYSTPAKCAGGGPPIIITGTGQSGGTCSGSIASTSFTWALCSCTDLQFSGDVVVDGFDSTSGPFVPGQHQLGGGVGFNEGFQASGNMSIYGTMWGAGTGLLELSSPSLADYDFRWGGNVKTAQFDVGNDAYVGGTSIIGTPFTVAETLYTAATVRTGVTQKKLVTGAVTVPPPCACEQKDIVPIAAIVDAHASTNDNALLSPALGKTVLDKPSAHVRIDLPCGEYYLNTIDSSNGVTIVTHGHTAIYVAGDVVNGGGLSIVPAPGSELDLFVKGTFQSNSKLVLGSPNYPAAMRVYVGGSADVNIAGDANIGANLYIPNARVTWGSTSDFFGAVFAKYFKSNSALNMHYDRAIVSSADTCPGPTGGASGDGGPATGDGGGGNINGCGSCRDCNNQACINGQCGDCTDSSQCCAPLVCVSGRCITPIK